MAARFLVVDDDPAVGRNLARLVRPFGEATVAGSVSGAMALLASQVPWDGFFVDLGLPDGSGLDVVATARSAFPSVSAMVLTGSVEPELINAVHDLGAHYVVKPVDRARIERFCREIAATEPGGDQRSSNPGSSAVPETLEGCIERLRELLLLRPDPLVRYAIGVIVAEIKAKPEQYGRSGVANAAAAVGEDVPTLYRHAAVAECWSEAEVRALLSRSGRDGRPLSWSHLVLLAAVSSPLVRRRLVKQALEEGLPVRALAALVAADSEKAPSTPE